MLTEERLSQTLLPRGAPQLEAPEEARDSTMSREQYCRRLESSCERTGGLAAKAELMRASRNRMSAASLLRHTRMLTCRWRSAEVVEG